MKPKSYKEQDGCHNCELCFVLCSSLCGESYFCTKDAPKRPPCGSVAMGEGFYTGPDGKFSSKIGKERMREWERWEKGREVVPWGKCDNYHGPDDPLDKVEPRG